MQPILYLSPQGAPPDRSYRKLQEAVEEFAPHGTLATITAGWEELEDERQALEEALGGRSLPLDLFARSERLWNQAPELLQDYRRFRKARRHLRHYYNSRLHHSMQALAELTSARAPGSENDPDPILEKQIQSATQAVRQLDQDHLSNLDELERELWGREAFRLHPLLRQESESIQSRLSECSCAVIAGGNVDSLLGLLKLFALKSGLAKRPVVAWSAGAMALSSRVVLFHDNPPHGQANSEVFDRGLDLAPGIIPLPHAQERLDLDNPDRVSRFANRFAPARAIVFDEESRLKIMGEAWEADPPVNQLTGQGTLQAWSRLSIDAEGEKKP